MVFASTRTEAEALLLEANLIKQLKPRFNVLLRDDKSFPYILLTSDERGAQLTKHRGARNRKGDYFGPFASVWAVNRTLNVLQTRLPAALLRKFLFTTIAAGPACCSRSSAAPAPAPAKSRPKITPNWRARRGIFWPANRGRCAKGWPAR